MKLSEKRQKELGAKFRDYCSPKFCIDEDMGHSCEACDGYYVYKKMGRERKRNNEQD